MNIKSIALAFIALLFCVNLRSIPERRISLKTSQDLNGKIEFDLESDNFPRLLARTNSSNVTTIYDHQGINEDLDGLITSAQGLVNVVSTATQEDFAVFDYNTYPLTHFKDPDAGYNAAFESMKNIVENQNNAPFYLLIGREIDRIDNTTNFRVALSLPSVDSFANITPSISYGLAELVADSINNYSANSILNQGTSSLSDVEAIGIEYLIDLLGNINSVIGNITEEYLTLSGFTKLPPQSTPEDLGIDPAFITTSGKVVNYAGLRYAQGDFGAEVLDGLNDMESYYSSFNISATAIITNNDVTEQEWLASETIYSGDGHAFYYWYHFYEPDDGVPTLWIKSKNSLTPSNAENILAFEYQQFLLELNSSPVLNLDGGNNREISNCETECPPLSLTNFKSWTAKKYILSSTCRDAGCSSTLINFLENYFQLGGGFQSEYHLGLTFGMFDGVLGTISFLSSVSEAFEFISAYTPSNPLGIKTILFRTVRKAAIEKGWRVWEWDIAGSFGSAYGDYWSESMSFWKKAFETLSILTNEEKRKTAISQIGNMILQYFEDFISVDDPLIMGHAHGVLVFEVLVEVLSGGGAIIKDIGKAGNRVKKLVSSFANGNQISIGGALLTLRSGANNLQNLWCKTLLNACFVAGTLVSTDVGAVPIENIQVGELIYSSKWVNERAVEDEYVDDLVSVDQLRVDQTSPTNTKWFEIDLKGVSKGVLGSEVKLLRPEWWIKENGIDALQSVVVLSMPEMGVEGHFLLIDKFQVSIPKSEIDKENGLSLSLVSGFFKKRAEVIHQLVFDYNDTIGVTPEHPFYSLSFSDWRRASDLSIGEKVLDRDGKAELTSRLIIDKKQVVYNLEVRNQHNYLVGNNGIVVHNTYVTPDELRDLVQGMKAPGSNPRLGGGRDQVLKALKELDLDDFILTPKLNQFIDDFTINGKINLSTFGTDGRMVKAWENVLDAPFEVRTNTSFLSKIDELSTLGFTSVELKKIGNVGKQLAQKYGDDAFTLQVCDDIASAMKNAKNEGFDAFGVDINIGSSFDDLLSSTYFKNSKADIENLTSQLRITTITNSGFIEQINEGLMRMNSSPPRAIYIESAIKQGDIVDDYLQEAVQLKALTSTNPGKVSQRLTSAVNQFTSEVPPSGYKKIAEVRVLNSSNPVHGFSSTELKTWLQTGVDNLNPTNLANYQSMDKLRIKTGLGIKDYKVDSGGTVIEL